MTASLMPPATDVSIHLLNMVLGSGWTGWFAAANTTGNYSAPVNILDQTAPAANSIVTLVTMASGAGSVIGSMMSALSGFLLLIGAAILVYTYGTGAANAAHTGEHKMSPMWTPLRQALGVAALAPLPIAGGISVIVSLVSFPVLLGIGLADNIATTAVTAMTTNGGQVAPASPPAINTTAVDTLLTNMVATTYVSSIGSPNPVWKVSTPVETWTPDNTSLTLTETVTSTGAFKSTLPPMALGSITLSCPSASVPGLCGPGGAAEKGLVQLVSKLSPIAAQIVNATNGYGASAAPTTATTSAPATGAPAAPTPGGIQAAIQAYQSTILQAISAYDQSQGATLSTKLSQISNEVDSQGWAALPTLYYRISQVNDAANGIASGLELSATPYDQSQMQGAAYAELDAAVAMAKSYEDTSTTGDVINIASSSTAAAATTTTGAPITVSLGNGKTTSWSNSLDIFAVINRHILSAISAGTDPIAGMQTASNWGIDTISAAYAADVALGTTAAGACGASEATPLVGAPTAAISCGSKYFLDHVTTALGFVAIPLLAALLVGAYYLPMAPAIVMTMGILSWVSVVVELFVASILWAFAHILPGGDNLVHEHSREGYFMILDVCMRPALMVFGYFLAIAMVAVSAYFVVAGLSIAFDSAMSGGTGIMQGNAFGPVSAVAELVILIGTLYVAISHSIGLIHRVPQMAMRMVGRGTGMDLGEEATETKVRGIAAGFVSKGRNSNGQPSGSPGAPSGGGKQSGSAGGGKKPMPAPTPTTATAPAPAPENTGGQAGVTEN